LRRCCNQQGEASNSNQPDHSAPPLSAQSLGPVTERGWYGSHVSPYRLQALVARTLEIDQGPCDSVDNSASFVGQREAIAIAANLRDANKQRGDTVSQKLFLLRRNEDPSPAEFLDASLLKPLPIPGRNLQ